MAFIEMQHCYKRYTRERQRFSLTDVFEIEKGELVIILGSFRSWKNQRFSISEECGYHRRGQVLIDGWILQGSMLINEPIIDDDVGFHLSIL